LHFLLSDLLPFLFFFFSFFHYVLYGFRVMGKAENSIQRASSGCKLDYAYGSFLGRYHEGFLFNLFGDSFIRMGWLGQESVQAQNICLAMFFDTTTALCFL